MQKFNGVQQQGVMVLGLSLVLPVLFCRFSPFCCLHFLSLIFSRLFTCLHPSTSPSALPVFLSLFCLPGSEYCLFNGLWMYHLRPLGFGCLSELISVFELRLPWVFFKLVELIATPFGSMSVSAFGFSAFFEFFGTYSETRLSITIKFNHFS